MRLILGSRTYCPLSDVTATAGDFCFGVSDVALEAERQGSKRLQLDPARKTLLTMAAEPEAEVVLYSANDPKTKRWTQGIADIAALLRSKGIEPTVIASPFPGSVCELITNLRHTTDKVVTAIPGARKTLALGKLLEFTAIATDKINEYDQKMAEGFAYAVGDDGLDEKWLRWCRCYQALCDQLSDARRALA